MTFDCSDVEAHKDACLVIQLGINNCLTADQAPKVGRAAAPPQACAAPTGSGAERGAAWLSTGSHPSAT
jgi:hypothetical protein